MSAPTISQKPADTGGPFCIDCARHDMLRGRHVCSIPTLRDLVTGDFEQCWVARNDQPGRCGTRAVFFVPKAVQP